MPSKQTKRGGTTPETRKHRRSRSSSYSSSSSNSRSRSQSRSPKRNRTKKLRFNREINVQTIQIDTPEYNYRHGLDDNDEMERRQRMGNLAKCPSSTLRMNDDGVFGFEYSANRSLFPCVHRGVIFENSDEYRDYYNGRARSINLGKETVAEHYNRVPGLQPSANKRKRLQKLKEQQQYAQEVMKRMLGRCK